MSQPDTTSSPSIPLTVGIDVAKSTLEVAIGLVEPTLALSNDERGFSTLLERLNGQRVSLIVLEATGGFHCGLVLHYDIRTQSLCQRLWENTCKSAANRARTIAVRDA